MARRPIKLASDRPSVSVEFLEGRSGARMCGTATKVDVLRHRRSSVSKLVCGSARTKPSFIHERCHGFAKHVCGHPCEARGIECRAKIRTGIARIAYPTAACREHWLVECPGTRVETALKKLVTPGGQDELAEAGFGLRCGFDGQSLSAESHHGPHDLDSSGS